MTQTTDNIDDHLFGKASIELDEPTDDDEKVDDAKLVLESRKLDIKEKRFHKAFSLVVICVVLLIIIYIIDTIVRVMFSLDISIATDKIIEILKALLFALIGYLFARNLS